MLDLLKKHYEKLLLLFMLLIFAGMMTYLLEILRATASVSEEDLMIETPPADYVSVDQKDRRFDQEKIFTTMLVKSPDGKDTERKLEWEKTPPRNPANKEFYTDLTEMFKAAVCPHENCGRIVPLFYFSGKTCPICKNTLPAPKQAAPTEKAVVKRISASQDTDKDGLPDLVENKYGMDPANGADALADFDGDGFSNVYEYMQGTDMKDPKKHPPLHQGLRVVAFEKTELPDRLLNVTSSGTMCQLESEQVKDGRRVRRSIFCTKGEKVMLDGQEYTVAEISRKIKGSGLEAENVSEVVFTCGEEKIVMQVNKPVYAPQQKVTLQSLFDGATLVLKQGSTVNLGTPEIGVEHYVIRELNPNYESVVIENTDTKKRTTIGKNYAVPEKYRAQKSAHSSEQSENGARQGR